MKKTSLETCHPGIKSTTIVVNGGAGVIGSYFIAYMLETHLDI